MRGCGAFHALVDEIHPPTGVNDYCAIVLEVCKSATDDRFLAHDRTTVRPKTVGFQSFHIKQVGLCCRYCFNIYFDFP